MPELNISDIVFSTSAVEMPTVNKDLNIYDTESIYVAHEIDITPKELNVVRTVLFASFELDTSQKNLNFNDIVLSASMELDVISKNLNFRSIFFSSAFEVPWSFYSKEVKQHLKSPLIIF